MWKEKILSYFSTTGPEEGGLGYQGLSTRSKEGTLTENGHFWKGLSK